MRAHGSTRAVSWLACAIGVCVIVAVLRSQPTRADFIYVDFNDTTGLLFNQNSTTTSCDDSSWVRHCACVLRQCTRSSRICFVAVPVRSLCSA